MSVVGFRSRNHPQQVGTSGPLKDVDDRAITMTDFLPLHQRFRFTVDAAATAENARLPRFWTAGDDALSKSWAGERIWANPPYSHPNLERWIRKAWAEGDAELIVMLIPANRTEQACWQKGVEPFRDRPDGCLRTEFLPGRMRFLAAGQRSIKANERPPFGCLPSRLGRQPSGPAAEGLERGSAPGIPVRGGIVTSSGSAAITPAEAAARLGRELPAAFPDATDVQFRFALLACQGYAAVLISHYARSPRSQVQDEAVVVPLKAVLGA